LLVHQALLTYSSGIVLAAALGLPLIDCRRRPSAKSIAVSALTQRQASKDFTF
jgi:hypothetical protein